MVRPLSKALGPFVTQYRDWIADQKKVLPSLTPKRREMAEALFQRAGTAAKRIEDGIKVLDDKDALFAFRMANRVMAKAARRRFGPMQGKDEAAVDAPTWRPFQLAFLLMNLPGHRRPDATTTARSSTCSSSRPAAARPKPTSAWPRSRWCYRRLREPGLSPRPG